LLCFLGFHPADNLGESAHDFPWNDITSLFNVKDMKDENVLKHVLRKLSLNFPHEDHLDVDQNLRNFKHFCQFMSPVSGCAVEGDHHVEIICRLSCSIALKEEAPFLAPDQAKTLEQSELLPPDPGLQFHSTALLTSPSRLWFTPKNQAVCICVKT
jgi:hypothetical protein